MSEAIKHGMRNLTVEETKAAGDLLAGLLIQLNMRLNVLENSPVVHVADFAKHQSLGHELSTTHWNAIQIVKRDTEKNAKDIEGVKGKLGNVRPAWGDLVTYVDHIRDEIDELKNDRNRIYATLDEAWRTIDKMRIDITVLEHTQRRSIWRRMADAWKAVSA